MSHLGFEKSKKLAEKITGIDIIVCGYYPLVQDQPLVLGNTLLVQAGMFGKSIGDLKITLDKNNEISEHEGIVSPLGPDIPDDMNMVQLLSKYREELAGKLKKPGENNIIQPATKPTLALYVTAEKCKKSHKAQYIHWKDTRHAEAFKTLQENQKEQNPNCQKCHTTGYNHFNGFKDLGSTPEMINVQCESCHNYGYKHVYNQKRNMASNKKINSGLGNSEKKTPCVVEESVCLKCHNQENSPEFNFKKYRKKIIH